MKFAHLADCHIGGWREPKMREANGRSFCAVIDTCLKEKVDFILISGDLFNTAVPAIDSLRLVVEQLKRVKDAQIPIYIIAGSHDFSPSGKTMLDVLEHAGLAINVAKGEELESGRLRLQFTIDEKTKVKITGMIGKKGGLEAGYYHVLEKEHLESEPGKKIFLFHSALAELKPTELEKMDAMAVSLLPQGFDYYAGGHVHVVDKVSLEKHKNIVYPGPVFPNNFSEIEKLKQGSFVVVDEDKIEHRSIPIHPVLNITVSAMEKTVSEVASEIKEELNSVVKNMIVTIRVTGCLREGKPADIPWNDILHDGYSKGAYFMMKNTASCTSKELQMIVLKEASVEELESSLLSQHASQLKKEDQNQVLAKKLMGLLAAERQEGERVTDFESRVHGEIDKLVE